MIIVSYLESRIQIAGRKALSLNQDVATLEYHFQILAERGKADSSTSRVPPDDRLRVDVSADHLHVWVRPPGRQHGRAGQVP